MRKVNYKEKGITLVALVITIILLLILAGVTLTTALGQNGLFKMAKKAVKEYQESEKQEQLALDSIAEELDEISIDYNDYVGCYVEGYEPIEKNDTSSFIIKSITSGLTSQQDNDGNTIVNAEENGDQKFTTEDLDWRIWDYNKYTKTIRLISSRPTNETLTLRGATGYNNGVWAINEICRQCYGQYDENGKMKNGISVANLRRSDIQKVSNYDYRKYKYDPSGWFENDEGKMHFGGSKTTYTSLKYPKMWEEYDSKWMYEYNEVDGTENGSDKECLMWEQENGYKTNNETGNSNLTFRESFYGHDYLNRQSEFINPKYYDLLLKKEDGLDYFGVSYYLAGRYVHLYDDNCDFGLQAVFYFTDAYRVAGANVCTAHRI